MQTKSTPTHTDGAVVARSLAILFLVGPTVAQAWVLLPHGDGANAIGVVATAAAAQVIGLVLLTRRAGHLPPLAYHLVVAAAPIFVSVAYAFSGSSRSGFAFFYLWVAPYAFVFTGSRHAFGHLAWAGACFAATLAIAPGFDGAPGGASADAGRWLIAMTTLVVIGVLARDMSERLRASHMRFRRGFEDAIVGMALIGVDCRWLSVNPALARMLERSREQLEGASIEASSHPEDGKAWRTAAGIALNGGPPAFTLELRLRLPDGKPAWARVNASLVSDDRGVPLYFTAQIEDITARKLEDERLRQELESVAWIGRLRDALDRDRLVLHAQPIVDVETGEHLQDELLLRMIGPRGELIPPDLFLPAAEHYGLIEEVDRWVVGCAARLAAAGRHVQVNLSGRSISHRELPDQVEDELREAGTDPGMVTFEITETALIHDLDRARIFAERMEALGCGFALDDFGTGYASFTSLTNLPVSYLKIDQEFVRQLAWDEPNREIVKAMVGLAHGLGQRTIAEGVEDEETLAALRECGVDYAQGFLLGRPAPLEPDRGERLLR